MTFDNNSRLYVIKTLTDRGIPCPKKYSAMLASAQPNRTIDGLRPWAFDHNPQSAVGFCSEAVGREVLPFAQAIGQDLMACFVIDEFSRISILVINPWASDRSAVVKADLTDFDAWLVYAEKISREVLAREHDESDED